MTPWTESAKGELENYFSRIRPDLDASGADPEEVIDDLRRHLAAEVANAGLSVVTEQDVRRLLSRIGAPEPPEAQPQTAPMSNSTVTTVRTKRMGAFASTMLLLSGVILPAVTLGIEGLTHMCAAAFFDPLPTIWHGFLVAFLVAVNWVTWSRVRHDDARWRSLLGWANGAAIAIAAFYALLFIPLVLPGVFAIIFFGWGLLPLSPLLALIATVILRNRLRALGAQPDSVLPGFWRGVLLGVIALMVVEFPIIFTRVGMQMAISDSQETRQTGIGWLRRVGKEDIMLRACYGSNPGAQAMDLRGTMISGNKRVSAQQAREIYYRVTGTPFNSVPAPTVWTGRGEWAGLEEWTWDADHGGDKVGGRIRGLSLNSSRLDSVVDADAAWSYTEWTLEFRNEAIQNREARAQILLPPGGAVSRVTLWVNDEEREAAFAGRSHVREAYRKIAVQQRRDPILITTAGPDRVMMQCFPVPARGGVMKVRIGITAPLMLDSFSEGIVRLPVFLERNFSIPEGTEHAVWLEAAGVAATASNLLSAESTESGGTALHGRLTNRQLASTDSLIHIRRDPAVVHAWTTDTRQNRGTFIRQSILESPVMSPERLIVVVDGSLAMSHYVDQISSALEDLGAAMPVTLLAASDGVATLAAPGASGRSTPTSPVEGLRLLRPLGGQDNVPALIEARELASETAGSAILWIHTPQPTLISSPEVFLQAYERRPNGPLIYELQTEMGPDRVVNKLNGLQALRPIPRMGRLEDDLKRLFESWNGREGQLRFERQSLKNGEEAKAGSAVETSLQIARLWALDEVRRLSSTRKVADAVELAALYQLVTPVSGAVVLENAQQYQETGLTPVDPQSVPAIPEPSTFALLLLGAGAFLMTRRRRRLRERLNISP